LKTSPSFLLKPFSHAGGLFGLLLALYQARPMVLFEKFVPEEWALAVSRHRPKSARVSVPIRSHSSSPGLRAAIARSVSTV
jgi:hypothetical protein